MIFFGKKRLLSQHYRVKIRKNERRALMPYEIPHYYICFDIGMKSYYIGYNRVKRIIKDKVYKQDGFIFVKRFGKYKIMP